MSLAKKAITGIIWNFAEQLARRGIGVAVTLLLAYFLTPEDFGLVAMMAVFLALGGTLMASGFQQALIRLKEATQLDFNTAFYANIALGLVAYIILYNAAPRIALFYEQPDLVSLIRVAALAVIVNSLQVVQVSILSRQLNFKAQLKANLPAALLSGLLAVSLAYYGWGAWALVVQMLVSAILITVFLWMQRIWRPSLSFCFTSLGHMYNFGYKLFLSGVLDIVFKNMYVIVLAKVFSSSVAGIYFFAEKIKELVISQLVTSIQTVTYPALSTMQDDDVRLKVGYRKVLAMTTFLMFPTMLFLAALSQPLFEFLLPKKWWPAVEYLQLMTLAGLLIPLHSINLNILKIKGRSDIFLYLEIIKKIMSALIFFVSIDYGVTGILIGQIISSVLSYIPNSYFSKRLIGYSVRQQLTDFLPGLVSSAVIAGFIFSLQAWVQWWALAELVVFGLLAGLMYLLSANLLKLHAYELTKELVLKKFKKVKPKGE
ncbi:lipopolysaccharide biosynthesis protein [Marinomonas algarum]|uniref:Lipopolysaccharide biosynthesis protein n=1 Tax=Marinomonas algarum TaxID=2883105 RepID=A0A9X1LEP0_9GAMM|nr:lipopolysaccharide biosynthesis protein [Marinomonas algarum]MCB5161515.1 lipopolysaccharide biosynthesis protein [Marinomonas algarum]